MLLLTSTSDLLRVVTGAAASITCSVAALDNTSGTISVPNLPPLASSLFKFSVRWPEVGGVPRVPGKVRVAANGNKAFRTAATVSVF